ncbi:MAG: hypothetical protein JJU36_15940 [Phycisphaeraceae bacterium]|nr:hypothetical protein [Phycisphaeraceae bacterium]
MTNSSTTQADYSSTNDDSHGSAAPSGSSEVRKAARDAVDAGKEALEGAKHMAQEGYEGAQQLAKDGYEGAKQWAKEGYEGARKASCDASDSVKEYIARHPMASVAIAAGAGVLLTCVANWIFRK